MSIFNYLKDNELENLYASLTMNNDDDIHDYMRKQDIRIFQRYSIDRGVFILVRRTNIYSVPYIGKQGFVPKPLECKPKTAKSNADFVKNGVRIRSECRGLVVNPRILNHYAFGGDKYKWVMARKTWDKYWGNEIPAGFAVQMDEKSKYYGCVMRVSAGNHRVFPSSHYETNRTIKPNLEDIPVGCAYIHGDYDLYALINKDRLSERESEEAVFEGAGHKHSKEWSDFEYFANQNMGVDMIQHGSQEHFCEHSDDEVDIFAPFETRHLQLRKIEGENGLKRIYRLFFDRHTKGEKLYVAGSRGIKVVEY